MIGHRLKGMSLLHTGEAAEARAHSIARLRSTIPPSIVILPRASAKSRRRDPRLEVVDLWLLGYSDAALADTKQALETARESGHAATLMYVLNFSVFQQVHCGHFAAANAFVNEFKVLKDQIGGVFWGEGLA